MNSWTLCLLIGSFVPVPHIRAITSVTCECRKTDVKCALLLGQKDRKTGTTDSYPARIMARLQQAEAHEPNLHYKQDYRQAWITTSLAQKGHAEPFLESSYIVYGVHPDKVFPRWLEDQKARLGREFYLVYNDQGVLRPNLPTIPPRNADTHAANEASSANWDGLAGLVPQERKLV